MAADGVKVQMVVTSPPYWGLRDYGVEGQIGLEETPEEYVATMAKVFRLVREVLADDGTLWLNLGDSYAHNGPCGGSSPDGPRQARETDREKQKQMGYRVPVGLKPKDLCGIPWRVALALQADGWYLRSDIIWHKPNPMPESVTDRPTKAHEYLFLLTKRPKYYYDDAAILEGSRNREGGNLEASEFATLDPVKGQTRANLHKIPARPTRNRRTVWTIPSQHYAEAHFATFPEKLVEPCILAGSRPGDIVLDPFMGSGTVAQVAQRLGRRWIGIDLNSSYIDMQRPRVAQWAMAL